MVLIDVLQGILPPKAETKNDTLNDEAEIRQELPFINEVDLYGIVLVIEYRDSKGQLSRRKISIITSRTNDNGAQILQAWCFERNAMRYFRLDRIQAVIDDDGKIWEPERFFNEELLVDYSCNSPKAITCATSTETKKRTKAQGPGVAVKKLCADAIQILTALGRSDGRFIAVEVAVALDYVMAQAKVADIPLSEDDKTAVLAWIKRVKATPPLLEKALENFSQCPTRDVIALLVTAEKLVRADGVVKDGEKAMLKKILESLETLKNT